MSDLLERNRQLRAKKQAELEASLKSDMAQTAVAHSGVGYDEQPAPPKGQAELRGGQDPAYFPTPDWEKLPSDVKALSYPMSFLGGLTAGNADEVAGAFDAVGQGKPYAQVKPTWERFGSASRQYHPIGSALGAVASAAMPGKEPAWLAKLPGILKVAGIGAAQGAGDTKMGGDTLGEALSGAGSAVAGYGALRGVGAGIRGAATRIDKARLNSVESALGFKTPEARKAFADASDPEGRREDVLKAVMKMSHPSRPEESLVRPGRTTEEILEAIKGTSGQPGIKQLSGASLQGLREELESGRRKTPGANLADIPAVLRREAEAAGGYEGNQDLAKLLRQRAENISEREKMRGVIGPMPEDADRPVGSLAGGGMTLGELAGQKSVFNEAAGKLARDAAAGNAAATSAKIEEQNILRRLLKEKELEQVQGLSADVSRLSGRDIPSEYNEALSNYGIADALTKAANPALDRIRAHNAIGLTAAIGAAGAAGAQSGSMAEGGLAGLGTLAAIKALQKYGPATSAYLLDRAGPRLPAFVGGVGNRLQQGALPMSSTVEPIRKYFETKELDEEEAKSHFNKNGG